MRQTEKKRWGGFRDLQIRQERFLFQHAPRVDVNNLEEVQRLLDQFLECFPEMDGKVNFKRMTLLIESVRIRREKREKEKQKLKKRNQGRLLLQQDRLRRISATI